MFEWFRDLFNDLILFLTGIADHFIDLIFSLLLWIHDFIVGLVRSSISGLLNLLPESESYSSEVLHFFDIANYWFPLDYILAMITFYYVVWLPTYTALRYVLKAVPTIW